ncbi:D-alanine--D-alanine ligase [Catenulispora sp. NF23]|uniref:D-alanine--D-alanine ligase n=1 Tax=Catenulispora pinistramenti TaxID=2705254 RepID=A0ABS5KLV3_9ACTN|nr:D-alanine--D-alanine ligase family protein [Catenulispora pinistramenti]MBS2531442.1 D-alanine--D-alanine ligase [Catenulispora pinistramenti]MBS2547020.1 D-alanine--D-alanine ligase [Catenulispora pinistramenti]
MSDQKRIRVAVVFGGRSSEHAISCVTAGSILDAVRSSPDADRYEFLPIGIASDGRWVLAELPEQGGLRLSIEDGRLPAIGLPASAERSNLVTMAGDPTARELTVHEPGAVPKSLGEVDVVLPLLHGPYGEDGTLQGLLELAGIPYVGSGVLASAVSMDKEFMKRLLAQAGFEIGAYEVVRPRDWATEEGRSGVRLAVEELGYPVFVKPARGGSSMGVTRVDRQEDLDQAIEVARRHDPKVLVEAAIPGREIECGVLEGLEPLDRPEASMPAELRVTGPHTFYDFEAKYLDGSTEVDIPARLSAEEIEDIREQTIGVFETLGAEGLARVDFFYQESVDGGPGRFIVNEINTMPGFTPTSMFPQMWLAAGMTYAELIGRLVDTAMRRPTGLR